MTNERARERKTKKGKEDGARKRDKDSEREREREREREIERERERERERDREKLNQRTCAAPGPVYSTERDAPCGRTITLVPVVTPGGRILVSLVSSQNGAHKHDQ